MDALRQAKTARDLLVNGSFVTSKAVPNDIDLILVEYVDLFKRVRYEAHQRKGISANCAMIQNDQQLEATFQALGCLIAQWPRCERGFCRPIRVSMISLLRSIG